MKRALEFCLLLGALAPTGALAHATLRRCTPAAGARLQAAPAAIALVFSEALEAHFSSVMVTDAAGMRVDRGDLKTAPGDAKSVTESLAVLKPGTYQVAWRAVSADTHKTQGNYRFTIAP